MVKLKLFGGEGRTEESEAALHFFWTTFAGSQVPSREGAIPQGVAPFRFCAQKSVETGNGGQMGVERRKLAVVGKPQGKNTPGLGRGRAKLREAADKMLEENSGKITQSLLDRTLSGNVTSARLLLELAEKKAEAEATKKKRRSPSLAKVLAAEPKWDGEKAETSEGQG